MSNVGGLKRTFVLVALLGLCALFFFTRQHSPSDTASKIESSASADAALTPENAARGEFKSEFAAIAAFDAWATQYQAVREEEKPELVAAGETLAQHRRQALATLIVKAPELALQAQVNTKVRKNVPASVAQHFEERISGRGDFKVAAAIGVAPGVPRVQRSVALNGRDLQAFVYGRREAQRYKTNIPLHGIALNGQMAVHESPVRVMEPDEEIQAWQTIANADQKCPVSGKQSDEVRIDVGGRVYYLCYHGHIIEVEQQLLEEEGGGDGDGGGGGEIAASAYTEGVKKLILLRVDFSDKPTVPIDDTGAANMIANLHNFYNEMSYGRTGFYLNGAGSAFTPVMRMPQTDAYYVSGNRYDQLRADARAAATALGFNVSTYNFDVISLHSSTAWGWGGLGYVGAPGSWVKSQTTGVYGHELGHNWGLWHANYWTVTDDSVIGAGTVQEYGNIFDTMGSASAGNNHFNAASKNLLNWLPTANTQTLTSSGTYRLYPVDHPALLATTQTQAYKIVKNTQRDYWLEFRQKFTAAQNRWINSGIVVKWSKTGSNGSDLLLDTTPGTKSGKSDSAVVIGRTFSDRESGIHITPIAKTGTTPEAVDVVVNFGQFPANTAPTAAITTPAGPTSVAANVAVNFTVTASDANGDALAYYWDFGDDTFGTNSASVSKSWAVAGDYLVRCTVSDMKGKLASDSVIVTVGAPATFRISGTVTNGGVPLEGVRVHNGLATTDANYRVTFTDSDGTYNLTKLNAGNYTVGAALDGFSFTAAFTNPVTVGPHGSAKDFTANAQPVVSIAAQDAAAAENPSNTGVFRISRSGSTAAALSVAYTLGGTAFNGSDYSVSLATPVSIPIGASFVDVTLTPVNDATVEAPETAIMYVADAAAYAVRGADATITIVSDEAPATPPEINVKGSNITITDGDTTPATADGTDFGTVHVPSGSAARTYTIENSGTSVLNLTGATRVVVGGANAADFTVSVQPPASVGATSSTTFTVVFDPSALGIRSATLSIANNDSDENPYNFSIQGNGANLIPEIALRGNNTVIASGDTTPSTADHTDFGATDVASGSVVRTFTIQNTGSATLNLTGIPKVAVSGSNPGDFTVNVQPAATVSAAGSVTFQVTFNPTATGARRARLSIANDDADENPYTFDIAGAGTVTNPLISFTQAASSGAESVASVTLTVSLSGPCSSTVTANCAINGGTAAAGEASLGAANVSFAPFETSKSVILTIVNDTTAEANETVIVSLSSPVNGTLGANASHTYTITDDDQAPPPPPPPPQPPQITSGPTATPNPAYVNQSVSLACAATAAGPITWEWDFGDGTSDASNRSALTHVFTSAGVWLVTVKATSAGLTTTATVTVTVNRRKKGNKPAAADDADADGISDAIELADGTDPFDSDSVLKLPLQVSKFSAKLSFAALGEDACALSGYLPDMPAGTKWAGTTVLVDIGGMTQEFNLDQKGKARSGTHGFGLKAKMRRNSTTRQAEFAGGNVAFTLQLKKSDLQSAWAAKGIDRQITMVKSMDMPVEFMLGGRLYATTVYAAYASKEYVGAKIKR